jgi:hypothetical protein
MLWVEIGEAGAPPRSCRLRGGARDRRVSRRRSYIDQASHAKARERFRLEGRHGCVDPEHAEP